MWVCHTLLSRRIMFLLVIKGNQQSALQQSHTGRGSNYTLFMFFLARWAEVGGCDEKQEKRRGILYFKEGRRPSGHFTVWYPALGAAETLQFRLLHWLVVSYRTWGWILLCVWDECSLFGFFFSFRKVKHWSHVWSSEEIHSFEVCVLFLWPELL